MQEELEAMGLVVEYKAFELPCCYAVIAIWQDKHGYPPLYVEVTVSMKRRIINCKKEKILQILEQLTTKSLIS